MLSIDDMLPIVKVLVHKSLMQDNEAVKAIDEYLWWGEFPEGAPIKCTRERGENFDMLLIFDPTDRRASFRGAKNSYLIIDLNNW